MPLYMRMPKRGFNNIFRKDYAEVNFWRIEQAVAAGKLDASKPIDAAALVASGILRRAGDGVKLLGKGELTSRLDITVHSASASAKAAVGEGWRHVDVDRQEGRRGSHVGSLKACRGHTAYRAPLVPALCER